MHSLLDALVWFFNRKNKTRLRYHVFEYFGVSFSIHFVVLVSRTRRNLLETGLNTVNCVAKCEISKFAFCILALRLYITILPKKLIIVCVRSKFFTGKKNTLNLPKIHSKCGMYQYATSTVSIII